MDHKHGSGEKDCCDDHGKHGGHHIVPLSVYYNTLGALIILTIVTVGASYMDFGRANFLVSMGIATFKAALVMLFFMGLKYDTVLNRGVILSSFVALFLLIFFTASDLWTRDKPVPVKVVSAVAALSMDEVKKMEEGAPELVAKGKEIFAVNCVSCHGAEGKGDGIAAATLVPKPRNFHAPIAEWKNGNSIKSIYVTLAYGIAGGGMASYKSLLPADRLALAHYIQSFSSGEKSGKADDRYVQALKEDGIGDGAVVVKKTTIPIDFAQERILKN